MTFSGHYIPRTHYFLINASIFWLFRMNKLFLGYYEYTLPLKDLLSGVSSITLTTAANEHAHN